MAETPVRGDAIRRSAASCSRRSWPRIRRRACSPTSTGRSPVGSASGHGPLLPRLARSRTIPTVDEEPVWSILCFNIRVGYRRQGVATALLDGLVDYARRSGAPGLEAYPIDPGEERVGSGFGYVGLTGWFERAGFDRVVETDGHSAGRVADPHAPDVLRLASRSWTGSGEPDGAGLGAQPIAMVGVGDADERRRPFALAPPEQLGHAEFGHDRPGVGPGGDHAGARRQRADDARDACRRRPWPAGR